MNEILETYTMTPEEEIKYLRQCVRELQEENKELRRNISSILNNNGFEFKNGNGELVCKLDNNLQTLIKENQILKKQLEYLRSGEYLNQLKFERNMLEEIVLTGEISKEDKEFIDMTHRNTELLSQQKEFIKYLEDNIESEKTNLEELCKMCNIPTENNGAYKFVYGYITKMNEILSKYKEIIGDISE